VNFRFQPVRNSFRPANHTLQAVRNRRGALRHPCRWAETGRNYHRFMRTQHGIPPSHPRPGRFAAFTRTELFVVILGVIVTLALLLPALANAMKKSSKITCVNNVKQIGTAFRLWAEDMGERYPTQVSTNEGGAMEFALRGEVFRVFQVMSNELNTPKIVVCANDEKPMATSFAPTIPSGASGIPFTGNSNVSYFVGLDASETNAMSWLTGDANLMSGMTVLKSGLLSTTNGQVTGWTPARHKGLGNLGFADGSAQQFSPAGLAKFVQSQTAWPLDEVVGDQAHNNAGGGPGEANDGIFHVSVSVTKPAERSAGSTRPFRCACLRGVLLAASAARLDGQKWTLKTACARTQAVHFSARENYD
jgi:prepilin-type processing-associated H-X9-DG protein